MTTTPPPLVVVMGVSGSGKTTVGAALAARLGLAFVDADDLHPAANIAKMSAGVALDDDDRAPWLHRIGQWLHEHDEAGGVVSCSALKAAYRDALREHAPRTLVAHLDGAPDLIARRQAARTDHFMPPSLLASQFAVLEQLRPDEAGRRVDVALAPERIVDELAAWLAPDPSSTPTPTATPTRSLP